MAMDTKVGLLSPTPELPDDTLIGQLELPSRIGRALQARGLITVGEVRETSDEVLMSFPDIGRGSIKYLSFRFPSEETNQWVSEEAHCSGCSACRCRSSFCWLCCGITDRAKPMSIGTIVLIILIIALLGGFSGIGGGPFYGTGYYGSGGLGLVIVVVVILLLMGRI